MLFTYIICITIYFHRMCHYVVYLHQMLHYVIYLHQRCHYIFTYIECVTVLFTYIKCISIYLHQMFQYVIYLQRMRHYALYSSRSRYRLPRARPSTRPDFGSKTHTRVYLNIGQFVIGQSNLPLDNQSFPWPTGSDFLCLARHIISPR